MPAVSKAQQKLMQIAEHHPSEVKAKNRGVLKMTHKQLHDFASGSEKGKPMHSASHHKSVGHYLEKDGKEHSKLPHHSEAAATPHRPAHVHHADYYDGRQDGHGSHMRKDGEMYRDSTPDGKRAP